MTRILVEVDADLADLIPGFLDNRRADVRRLREALDADDRDSLRRIGHSLKGVGGGYGFDTITDLGLDIESAAIGGDLPAARAHVDALADYLQQVDVVFR